MRNASRALINGLRFSFLLTARDRQALSSVGGFWCAALLSLLADIALNRALVDRPEEFVIGGLSGSALEIVKALAVGWGLSWLALRPALIWALATWLLVIGTIARVVAGIVLSRDAQFDHSWIVFDYPELAIASGIWLWLGGCRIWHWLEPRWPWYRVIAVATAGALPLALILRALPWQLDYFYGSEQGYEDDVEDDGNAHWPENIHLDTLFAEQASRVDQALQSLSPQRPGKVDIYVLAVGGYASEDVFRNEVDYVQALFDQRFGTQGRSVSLLNHVDTLSTRPLATQANIERALAGIAARIDRDEDVVFLFVTSHGSEDHELAIDLLGLPLQQVTPESLSDAVRESGIRWRVDVVSACFSGGYIDALSASTAMVLTAARKDRTSFGCGADADVTYFGRAFFIEALNQTDDFRAAFEIARDAIAIREAADDETPSEPQISSNPLIEAKLAAWRAQQAPGPSVPFVVPIKSASADEAGAR